MSVTSTVTAYGRRRIIANDPLPSASSITPSSRPAGSAGSSTSRNCSYDTSYTSPTTLAPPGPTSSRAG